MATSAAGCKNKHVGKFCPFHYLQIWCRSGVYVQEHVEEAAVSAIDPAASCGAGNTAGDGHESVVETEKKSGASGVHCLGAGSTYAGEHTQAGLSAVKWPAYCSIQSRAQAAPHASLCQRTSFCTSAMIDK